MLSGHGDLFTLRLFSSSIISSTVISMSVMEYFVLFLQSGMLFEFSVVNTEEKKLFKVSHF